MTRAPSPIEPNTRSDPRGSLSVLTGMQDLPFAFERVFWIHGAPAGTVRGAHAHIRQHQAVVCMAGALDILVDDGINGPRTVLLDRPGLVLHLPPKVWSEQTVKVGGTVYMVLASGAYDVQDYLTSREDWERAVRLSTA